MPRTSCELAQMARRYLLQPLIETEAYRLPRDLGHHLCSVMRLRVGERVRLFDGSGLEAEAELIACQRDQVDVCIGTPHRVDREPTLQLSVAFPVPRGARCDWLFEHCCELGVRHFLPLVMARSRQARAAGRGDRWHRILEAAAGQCDRSQLPEIHPIQSLDQLLSAKDLPRARYFAEAGSPSLAPTQEQRALLLVGPEGGLTEAEREALLAAKFMPRSLGPLTLRSETAVLVGAARLLQETETQGSG